MANFTKEAGAKLGAHDTRWSVLEGTCLLGSSPQAKTPQLVFLGFFKGVLGVPQGQEFARQLDGDKAWMVLPGACL